MAEAAGPAPLPRQRKMRVCLRSSQSGAAETISVILRHAASFAASVRFREEPYLKRNHAILVALLVRIFKFMRCIAILTAESPESREVVYALNRCIAESLINFFYLMRKDEEAAVR